MTPCNFFRLRVSQDDEDTFGPNITDPLARKVELRWQNELSGEKLKHQCPTVK